MITIISSTNRPENNTLKIASYYYQQLIHKGQQAQLFSLEQLPTDFSFNNDVFGSSNQLFSEIVKKNIQGATKFVFIVPEYNGSFPGALKALIDGVWPEMFRNKKAALVGVASGRAGNIRGLDHLTGILNYLRVYVLPNKVYLPSIDKLLGSESVISDERTLQSINKQIDEILHF
jgi:chromate reductase